jgi:hypothetical protein
MDGLLPMPQGHVWEGGGLRSMTEAERVISGLDEPQPGFKVVDNDVVEMSLQEKLKSGLISREEHDQALKAENEAELQRRLMELQSPKAISKAEVDSDYAAQRKAQIAALLAVENQEGWPLEVKWPESA